jgi:hypothetical protein
MKTNRHAQWLVRMKLRLALVAVLAFCAYECGMVWRFGRDSRAGFMVNRNLPQTAPSPYIPPCQIQSWGDLLAAR